MSTYVLVIVAYFAVVVALGVWTRRIASRSAADYLVAGRNLNVGVCGVVVGTPEFIPPVLGGVALAGMLTAILSTMGPVNFAIVAIAAKDIYHGFINPEAKDEAIVATARRLVILVSLVTIPLAIFIRGAILDSGYVSYAIRAIGAIVVLLGLYRSAWISSLAANLAFIVGTAATLLCVLANRLHWFLMDKTYGAVATALLVIISVNLYERLMGTKNGEPTVGKC